ncbi:hypothetical protein X474_22105 [Dethiosulfatarculus sandiegensis]|uniref:Uncharacterized protein n=1 Tax=Dethiosulfatarculus sandiegensis TaxID=1429043 RepID=A0A0D2GAE9_9BACT|nr:hypothetical protein X474_22105 [Dethiosulfatarculus sandiegensis]
MPGLKYPLRKSNHAAWPAVGSSLPEACLKRNSLSGQAREAFFKKELPYLNLRFQFELFWCFFRSFLGNTMESVFSKGWKQAGAL